jgi:hypothetical protein
MDVLKTVEELIRGGSDRNEERAPQNHADHHPAAAARCSCHHQERSTFIRQTGSGPAPGTAAAG